MARRYRKLPELSQQDIQRFWKYVDKTPGQGPTGECWSWTRGRMPKGYGQFIHQRLKWYTHRIAFFLGHGLDPDQENVCHHCDYPPCCNPSHLFKGSQKINIEDCIAKGRKTPPPISTRRGDTHPNHVHPEHMRRGEDHRNARLNNAKVLEIRRLRDLGATQPALSLRFGVNQATISDVILRKSWKHI